MKTKKIAERAKKKNPDRNVEKALKPLFKKKVPGTAKGTAREKDLNITKRKEVETGLGKTRKELAVIKKTADEASEFAESIINTVREPLLALDKDLRVVKVSRSFYDFFKVKPEKTVGQHIYDLGNRQWDIPRLRELLETILPQKAFFDNYEVEHDFASIGRRVMLLSARQVKRVFGREKIILLAIEDITERKRLEILLKDSEALFKGAFKTASDGILFLEKGEGKITHVNPAAEKMLGYSAKECIGNKLRDIGVMLATDDFQTIMKKLNKNGMANYKDVQLKANSGKHIVSDIYFVDKTKVVQCNIRDISERKRVEQELYESEARYRTFFETSRDCVFISSLTGKWLYMNDAAVELFGYSSREELSQVNIAHLYVNPEERAKYISVVTERGYAKEFPADFRRKDGTVIDGLITAVPRYGSDGKMIGFQGTVRDITERKRMEEESNRLASLIRHSLELVNMATPDGTMFFLNDAGKRMLGISEADVAQTNIMKVIPDHLKERVRREVLPSIAEHGYWEGDLQYINLLTGGLIDVHAITFKISNPKTGALQFLANVSQDITERKRAEEKIRNSLVEKEILLKEVHHRVNNNLMTIIGLIKMQEAKANNEIFNPLLRELEGRVRAMALVHESLHKSVDLVHVDLQNYIETISAHIHAQFRAERDIRFSVRAAGVEVGLDIAVPCGLILNELITNAYKHAFPGDKLCSGASKCEIDVALKQEAGALMLTVADNGVGLPAGVNWKNPETVGLQLVNMLSKQLNGSIELDRSAGTVFRLSFPHPTHNT